MAAFGFAEVFLCVGLFSCCRPESLYYSAFNLLLFSCYFLCSTICCVSVLPSCFSCRSVLVFCLGSYCLVRYCSLSLSPGFPIWFFLFPSGLPDASVSPRPGGAFCIVYWFWLLSFFLLVSRFSWVFLLFALGLFTVFWCCSSCFVFFFCLLFAFLWFLFVYWLGCVPVLIGLFCVALSVPVFVSFSFLWRSFAL